MKAPGPAALSKRAVGNNPLERPRHAQVADAERPRTDRTGVKSVNESGFSVYVAWHHGDPKDWT
jgi:hypothetical protein